MEIRILYVYTCPISKDIGITKELEICLPNKESISGQTYEETSMPYIKHLRLSILHLMGIIHMYTVSNVICMDTENKICLPNKEYICFHWW